METNKEKIEFPIKKEYISMQDAMDIQIMASQLFENFDGGFGMMSNDQHALHQPIRNDITIGFTTTLPSASDLASYSWPPNNLSLDKDYVPYKKSIRFSLLEVLFEICMVLGVRFTPTKDCIKKCLKTSQTR